MIDTLKSIMAMKYIGSLVKVYRNDEHKTCRVVSAVDTLSRSPIKFVCVSEDNCAFVVSGRYVMDCAYRTTR